MIAPSKNGEPQASQSPLGVTDHNDSFSPRSFWRRSRQKLRGEGFSRHVYLGLHRRSLKLGRFTPGYQLSLLRSWLHPRISCLARTSPGLRLWVAATTKLKMLQPPLSSNNGCFQPRQDAAVTSSRTEVADEFDQVRDVLRAKIFLNALRHQRLARAL